MEYWIILLIYIIAMFLLISGWQYYGTRLDRSTSSISCSSLQSNVPRLVPSSPSKPIITSAPDLCAKLNVYEV
ncbi:Hypothetical predicted protein [Octopus vulgaris]|nr:Hypothetical predicted protein [Octopus vulgaris]